MRFSKNWMGAKSAGGGHNPLADIAPGGHNPLADFARGGGGGAHSAGGIIRCDTGPGVSSISSGHTQKS